MAIEFRKKMLVLSGSVGVEDAEGLLESLQDKISIRLDLKDCEHIHPANLQVLLAAGATVNTWPANADLANWLKSAFNAT
jgi:hypothetical protein